MVDAVEPVPAQPGAPPKPGGVALTWAPTHMAELHEYTRDEALAIAENHDLVTAAPIAFADYAAAMCGEVLTKVVATDTARPTGAFTSASGECGLSLSGTADEDVAVRRVSLAIAQTSRILEVRKVPYGRRSGVLTGEGQWFTE